jgi:hypothetical protein
VGASALAPVDMVEALRAGLYIEFGAANEALARTWTPAGHDREPDRYERLDATRALLSRVGRQAAVPPVAVHVDLDEHRLALLAGLHGKLEADGRLLGHAATARDRDERVAIVARLDALGEFISTVEARGAARPSDYAAAAHASIEPPWLAISAGASSSHCRLFSCFLSALCSAWRSASTPCVPGFLSAARDCPPPQPATAPSARVTASAPAARDAPNMFRSSVVVVSMGSVDAQGPRPLVSPTPYSDDARQNGTP